MKRLLTLTRSKRIPPRRILEGPSADSVLKSPLRVGWREITRDPAEVIGMRAPGAGWNDIVNDPFQITERSPSSGSRLIPGPGFWHDWDSTGPLILVDELWEGRPRKLLHSAVSEEDFVKEPLRNRLAVLASRTNHVSYHGGQLVLTRQFTV